MSETQKLQSLTDDFQSLQKDLQTIIEARQRLDSQLTENQAVQEEFSTLEDSASIYKLVGPILLKQDRTEAVQNVEKRLEFIQSEIKRIETQLNDGQEKAEMKKIEIMTLQTKLQSQQQGQVA